MTVKKKPTAAQLKARKLFAERSKAGTLRKNPAKKVSGKTRKKNPLQNTIEKKGRIIAHFQYVVQTSSKEPVNDKSWREIAGFKMKPDAADYARALAAAVPGIWIRVVDCD